MGEPKLDLFEPLEWQIAPLNNTSPVMLLTGSAGGGKLLPLDTPIPTPLGWKTMGEIQVGNLVLGADGMPTRVVGISDIQYPRKAYRIEFDDKSSIIAGSDHQWLSHTNAARSSARNYSKRLKKMGGEYVNDLRGTDQRDKRVLPSVVTTEEMLDTLTVGNSDRKNHAIQVALPIQLPEKWLPMPPYCLGMWLGDGHSNGGGYTVHVDDVFLLDEWERYGYQVKRSHNKNRPNMYSCHIRPLAHQLSGLGILNNKRIPTRYLRGSFQQRLELLQGLIDTDGHVNKRGQVSIDMARYDLMCDIRELVLSLGIKARIREGSVHLNGKEFVRYRMKFTTNLQVARLPRKRNRLPLGQELRDTQRFRYVTSITEITNVPMKCIEVDNDDHLYLAGESFIPTHNSRCAGEKVAAYCMTYPGSTALVLRKIMTTASNSTILLFKNVVLRALIRSGECRWEATEKRFSFSNGSVIMFSGMKTDEQRENIRSIGTEGGVDIAWMEEAIQFEEDDFDELVARMRGKAAHWRQILLTTNPGPETHWIYQRIILKGQGSVYYSRAAQNVHNPGDYEERLDSLRGLLRKRLRDGIWSRAGEIIFSEWLDDYGVDLSQEEIMGNVTREAEYIPNGGDVQWWVDDGYAGEYDPESKMFSAKSHPRTFLVVQVRKDGRFAIVHEDYRVLVLPDEHIRSVYYSTLSMGIKPPSKVVYDRAAATLGGYLRDILSPLGIPKSAIVYNTVPVDDGNNLVNTKVAADKNGVRMVIVSPECVHLRREIVSYATNKGTNTPRKEFDHGPDAMRMGLWENVNGGGSSAVDVASIHTLQTGVAVQKEVLSGDISIAMIG